MNVRKCIAISIVALVSAGCASKMLTDDRLRDHTAPLVGVSAADVTISNRTEQGTNPYYTAKTKAGAEFTCSINGGGALAMGMVQGAQCTKKAEAPKPARGSKS